MIRKEPRDRLTFQAARGWIVSDFDEADLYLLGIYYIFDLSLDFIVKHLILLFHIYFSIK